MPQGEDRLACGQCVVRHASGLSPRLTASMKYTAFASYVVRRTADWRRLCSCRHSRHAAWATFPSRQTSEPSIASNTQLRMHTVQPNPIFRAPPHRLLLSLHRYIEQWSTYREHIPFANGFTWNARTLGTIAIWAGVFPYFVYTASATAFALLHDLSWWP